MDSLMFLELNSSSLEHFGNSGSVLWCLSFNFAWNRNEAPESGKLTSSQSTFESISQPLTSIFASRFGTKSMHDSNRNHSWKQCDQMTKLSFQYLAISSNDNLPQNQTNCIKVSWKLCPKPKNHIFLNIGQGGGISPNLVTMPGNKQVRLCATL